MRKVVISQLFTKNLKKCAGQSPTNCGSLWQYFVDWNGSRGTTSYPRHDNQRLFLRSGFDRHQTSLESKLRIAFFEQFPVLSRVVGSSINRKRRKPISENDQNLCILDSNFDNFIFAISASSKSAKFNRRNYRSNRDGNCTDAFTTNRRNFFFHQRIN